MFEQDIEETGKGTWLIVLGPLFGLLYVCFLPLIALVTLLLALPDLATAKKAEILETGSSCMSCHSSADMSLTLRDNEKLSLFVDAADFRDSIHRSLNCTDCHQKISLDSHPSGSIYDSRSAFALEAAVACRTCHTDAQLTAKPNHAYMANKTNAPPCTRCHGSHGVKSIAAWKPALSGNQYCLTCHRQKISKTFNNGEKVSLSIDPSVLASSVHNRHACSDCHTEFTRQSHPVREFTGRREHSIAVSGACQRCHPDKARAVRETIHYNMSFQVGDTLIRGGRQDAPVCTDCHGFHAVGPKDTYATLSGVPCRKCHEEIFRIYSKSVHGLARAKGEHRAPLCYSCHFAHEVKAEVMNEKIRGACTGCHNETETKHAKWLPNAQLHLSVIACAACHSPNAGRGIRLRLYDQSTGRPFTEEQMKTLLGADYEIFSRSMNSHGAGIDSETLRTMISQLNERGGHAKLTYMGRMEVGGAAESHQLAVKKNAVKECESCHNKDSSFFKTVTLAVVRADGSAMFYKARPEVLGSVASIFSLSQFYVLGSTRLKFLDWVGIAMVLGGVLVPAAHITFRVLTKPVREARKNGQNKEGKR